MGAMRDGASPRGRGVLLTSSSGLTVAAAGDNMGHPAAAGAGMTSGGGVGLTAAGGAAAAAEEGQGERVETGEGRGEWE